MLEIPVSELGAGYGQTVACKLRKSQWPSPNFQPNPKPAQAAKQGMKRGRERRIAPLAVSMRSQERFARPDGICEICANLWIDRNLESAESKDSIPGLLSSRWNSSTVSPDCLIMCRRVRIRLWRRFDDCPSGERMRIQCVRARARPPWA